VQQLQSLPHVQMQSQNNIRSVAASISSSCPDAIHVSIQFLGVCDEKYEGRSLQRMRETFPEGKI